MMRSVDIFCAHAVRGRPADQKHYIVMRRAVKRTLPPSRPVPFSSRFHWREIGSALVFVFEAFSTVKRIHFARQNEGGRGSKQKARHEAGLHSGAAGLRERNQTAMRSSLSFGSRRT